MRVQTKARPSRDGSIRSRSLILLLALVVALLAACQPLASPHMTLVGGSLPAPQAIGDVLQPQSLLDVERLPLLGDGSSWDAESATFPTVHAGKPKDPSLAALPPQNEFEGLGDGPLKRSNFFLIQRSYPEETLPAGALPRAVEAMQSMQPIEAAETLPVWQNIGPAPMLDSAMGQQPVNVTGRVRALAIDPGNANVVYIGSALGGVWKTTNGGDSWTPLTDDQASLAVGAMALDPNDADTIYVGTGEPTPGLDNYYGAGILKSTDGGQNWNRLGASVFTGLGIAKIIVSPNNSNLVYVAASRAGIAGQANPPRGIFRSTDGGQSWQSLLGCQDCFGASDLVMDAKEPSVLYASFWGNGIFKSIDGGNNWSQLTGGLPNPQQYQVGRVILTISPTNPNILYASYQLTVPDQYDGAVLFKSTNAGQSWTELQVGYNYCGSQCWYSHEMMIHPQDPDTVLIGGSAFYAGQSAADLAIRQVVIATRNGGQTWTDLTPNTNAQTTLHPDMHVIEFDPSDTDTIWVGNDGGVWKSSDGGATWQNRNTNLATLQFTGIAVDPKNPQIIQGGMQDNNKAFTTNGGATVAWTAADRGDGGFAAIDPFNSNIWYGARFNRTFQRNNQGAAFSGDWAFKTEGINQQDRSLFYIPFTVDPSTQGVLYLGTYRLYRTTNRGDSWAPVSEDLSKGQGYVSAITVAPSQAQTIYVGTSDGNIQVTRNSGGSWTNVSKAPLPNRYVSRIAVSPTNPQVAYAVYNGFNTHTPNTPGHIFKTTNAGGSWQNISGNLPDVPALSLALSPNQPGTIYLGTDTGVYRTIDDGQQWLPFNNGMPFVAVIDLVITTDGQLLFAGTHGRSVLRVDLSSTGAPTATPTVTPTATRTTTTGESRLFLPNTQSGGQSSGPTSTATATATATHTSTPEATATPSATPTTTFTPVTPEGTQLPTATVTPTPTRTPTPTVTATATATHTPGTPGAPTPTATPTITATPTPPVTIFSDGFGDTDSGWPEGTAGVCEFGYATASGNGIYYVDVSDVGMFCISPAPSPKQGNGVIEVAAATNTSSVYGLVFGLDAKAISEDSNFYIFWVDPVGQEYALQKRNQRTWTNLTGTAQDAFVTSSAVLSNNPNLLKVRREGSSILLFVNDIFLTAVDDNSFPTGFVGLASWARYTGFTEALYDNFLINGIQQVYADPYTTADSGWFEGSIDVCQAGYVDGEYRTATQADYVCYYRAPANAQPNGRFAVEARREESFYSMAYGLFFAEDGGFNSFYAFFVVPDTQTYALAKYIAGDGWYGVTWDTASQSAWLYSPDITPTTGVNDLVAERDGNLLRIAVNGVDLGGYLDPSPLVGGYYGVITSSSQFEASIANFDDYGVVAWDSAPPMADAASAANPAAGMTMPELDRQLPQGGGGE